MSVNIASSVANQAYAAPFVRVASRAHFVRRSMKRYRSLATHATVMHKTPAKTDVLVVGGGPVGLLIAYQLSRFKCSTVIVEKEDKPNLPIYGRATTLWVRSQELLDQLEVCEGLLDHACFTKNGVNYRNGKAVPGGMPFGQRMDKHGDTRFGFSLHLRQRLVERTFENALEQYGVQPRHQHELLAWKTESHEEYPVHATLRDNVTQEEYQVQAKYMVAADGGRSFVRETAGIGFPGDRSSAEWIRMDALVETDMPSPRTLNSIQSDSHGLVLWCPIDESKVRIGYVFSQALREKYNYKVDEETVMTEAKLALAPFKLEFKKLDWFTCYGIGQRIADEFIRDRIILAGDACHTHSSGSAQGLNTGILDAVNLSWKLAMHLRGMATEALVKTYEEERKAAVQQVIDNDKIIATLISGDLPPRYKDRKEHPRDILDEFLTSSSTIDFTIGLGVQYAPGNLINGRSAQRSLATVVPGMRAPETYVTRLATNERVALQRIMLNTGHFHAVIFSGAPAKTFEKLQKLQDYLLQLESFTTRYGTNVIKLLCIVGGSGSSASDALDGLPSFGRTYYDTTLEAHQAYGVDTHAGAIIIFRPDGYIGKIAALDNGADVTQYFDTFLVESTSGQRDVSKVLPLPLVDAGL